MRQKLWQLLMARPTGPVEGVHDVIADARPLLLAESLLQRGHLLLTLSRRSG